MHSRMETIERQTLYTGNDGILHHKYWKFRVEKHGWKCVFVIDMLQLIYLNVKSNATEREIS